MSGATCGDLTTSQRAMIAAKLATLKDGQRAGLARSGEADSIGTASRAEAAKALKVGIATVQRARTVRKTGTPALIEAVERGEIAVAPAARAAAVAEL